MRPGSWLAGLGLAAAIAAAIAVPLPGAERREVPVPSGHIDIGSVAAGARIFRAEFPTCVRPDGTAEPPDAVLADAAWDGGADDLARWLASDFGGAALPGLAGRLAPPERAALIGFLRVHLAGREMAVWGRWLHPLPAPDVAVRCGDDRLRPLGAWRGQAVRLVAGDGVLALGPCTVTADGAWDLYALIAGLPPDLLSGTTFVIDADGMLAARELPGPGLSQVRFATAAPAAPHDHPASSIANFRE